MDDYKVEWVYNDGDWQIEFVDLSMPEQERKFYDVYRDYKLTASFRNKEDALKWVGWKNYQERKLNTEKSRITSEELSKVSGIEKQI